MLREGYGSHCVTCTGRSDSIRHFGRRRVNSGRLRMVRKPPGVSTNGLISLFSLLRIIVARIIQKKICMLGDFAAGKTSLVRRFVEGRFDDRYLSTIGVKVSRRKMALADGQEVHLLIWDLAGSEEFVGVQQNYLRGAAGAVLVCDLTRQSTLESLEKYAQRLSTVSPGVPIVLLGNKNDLVDARQISDGNLETVAQNLRTTWFTTSAKTGENVERAFADLAGRIFSEWGFRHGR